MLQTLSLGMQRIALPEAARAEFLDTCFALQTAAMRDAAAPAPTTGESPETPATPQAVGVAPTSSELRIGTQLLRIFDLAGSRTTGRYRQALVRTGDWVAFRMADDQPLSGRICSISKESGKLLLANPDWDFAVLLHPAIMESQIREGKAGVSSRVSLFNAAAEQALRRTPEAGEVRPG